MSGLPPHRGWAARGDLDAAWRFHRQHASEILGLVHHETAEKLEHPLNRTANIERTDAGVVIATTDIHLPRRIGEAIERAYRGTLEMHFDDAAYFMRADWRRPS